jgi:hypothetical protein
MRMVKKNQSYPYECGSFHLKVVACTYYIHFVVSYPVFMPKPSTHRMHDPGSNVPHIRPKVLTDNQMS